VEEGGETFEDQIDGIAAAMRGQGGLAVGDFNYTACSKWREGGASALSGSDRLFRAFAGRACACCPKKARAPISSVLVQQAEGELWTHKAGPKAKGKSKIELKIIRDQDQRKMGSSLVFQRHCGVSQVRQNTLRRHAPPVAFAFLMLTKILCTCRCGAQTLRAAQVAE
jgi:hypothetical protein